jgi:hypothetical protein
MKFVIERWTGKNWCPSLCSPYNTMSNVNKHLKKYAWHYTTKNPYRITSYKPKKKVQKYVPKYSFQAWNSDDQMVVKI